MRNLLLVLAAFFSTSALAVKDTKLTHDKDLIAAMDGAAQSCVTYAARSLGAALVAYKAIDPDRAPERRKAWSNVTYTRYFEACMAEVAREIEDSVRFDQEDGKQGLAALDPLYVISGPPEHVDATVTVASSNTVKYDGKAILLRELLSKIWAEQWKDVVVVTDRPASEAWCLLHLGFASGARLHIRSADGSWAKLVLNAGTGEKGMALAINQCLSGDIDESRPENIRSP